MRNFKRTSPRVEEAATVFNPAFSDFIRGTPDFLGTAVFLARRHGSFTIRLRRVLDTQHKLEEMLPRLRHSPWLAIDTEADSLHAYPEKLCLIQISYPKHDVLVDPLAKLDLAPLFAELAGRELLMHGSDYDLRLFCRYHNFAPHAVFDTMIASRLLGCRKFGLSDLLAEFLGVTLDKGSQKANWARRPLTERMEQYARNDTHHLHPLVDSLRARLEEKGRLAWVKESCAQLVRDCAHYEEPDPNLVWRVKGSSKLPRKGLAVLREIWRWREEESISHNRPPFFMLAHEVMTAVANAAAHSHSYEPIIPRHLTPRRREGLLDAIQRALALPSAEWPHPLPLPPRRYQTEAQKKQMEELTRRRDHHARELDIDPTLIASRATLVELADDWDANHGKLLLGWQRDLLSF